jgi:hypothetical protein
MEETLYIISHWMFREDAGWSAFLEMGIKILQII